MWVITSHQCNLPLAWQVNRFSEFDSKIRYGIVWKIGHRTITWQSEIKLCCHICWRPNFKTQMNTTYMFQIRLFLNTFYMFCRYPRIKLFRYPSHFTKVIFLPYNSHSLICWLKFLFIKCLVQLLCAISIVTFLWIVTQFIDFLARTCPVTRLVWHTLVPFGTLWTHLI